VLVRLGELAQPFIEQRQRAMHIGAARILLFRALELFLGHFEIALPQVSDAELHIKRRGTVAARGLWIDRSSAAGSKPGERSGENKQRSSHACTATPMRLSPRRTVVRSTTRPASWPQAASMSSPRVRRVVAITPLRINSSRNRWITSAGERRY